MKCPFCHEGTFEVIDSRSHQGAFPVRRRRHCSQCGRRVWTVENVEEVLLQVIKKDESREVFDLTKLRRGLEKACYKRPISTEQVETIVRQVDSDVRANYFAEVPAAALGEMVMDHLKKLDQVAYIRFASVYREFKDINDLVQEVQPMLAQTKRSNHKRRQQKENR